MAAPLEAEALRANTRYIEEVVIGWNLCPWAAHAWRHGQVERRVLPGATPDLDVVSEIVAELGAKASCAIGLLLFPDAEATVGGWESFAERVRRRRGPFHVAAFHPFYRPPGAPPVASAAALVPLIRRTPDPTLQLVRASLLDEVAGEDRGRDVSAEIASANFETVSARTPAALEALLDDIRRDRDAARARLAPK